MKYLLIFCALLLASCAHPNTPPPPQAEPIGLDSPIELRLHADDSGYTPSQVVRRRLFGLLPPKAAPLPEVAGVPRKCKGCTFNVVSGNQTNNTAAKKATQAAGDGATASVIEKKAGPAQVASDSSTLNALTGSGNLAAVQGDGNTTGQTKQDTTIEPPDVGATIAKYLAGPLGYVLAAAAAAGIISLIVRRRAKKAAEKAAENLV